jgi:hypothetical protein
MPGRPPAPLPFLLFTGQLFFQRFQTYFILIAYQYYYIDYKKLNRQDPWPCQVLFISQASGIGKGI